MSGETSTALAGRSQPTTIGHIVFMNLRYDLNRPQVC